MKKYRIVPNAMKKNSVLELRTSVLNHPLIGESPLKGTFTATRGFAIAFTLERLPDLIQRFSKKA